MFTPKLDTKTVHHPAVASQFEAGATDAQLRLADRITAFAGSMTLVYIRVLVFATLIVLKRSPWPCADAGRLARSNFPLDVRDDRAEPPGGVPAG
jgi:hypothetical protein